MIKQERKILAGFAKKEIFRPEFITMALDLRPDQGQFRKTFGSIIFHYFIGLSEFFLVFVSFNSTRQLDILCKACDSPPNIDTGAILNYLKTYERCFRSC